MSPQILAFVSMIAKTLIFKDATPDAKKAGLDGRPFWSSRRFLHSAITSVIALAAAFGISIPADQAAILMDAVGQIVTIVKENAGLWPVIASSAGAIWGTIRAGKSGGKGKE